MRAPDGQEKTCIKLSTSSEPFENAMFRLGFPMHVAALFQR
jgi:hypothetical protein